MYLDYAENQAKRHIAMTMAEWKEKLNAFLEVNEYGVLKENGKVKREVANELAYNEYEKYRKKQDIAFESDFDILVNKTINEKKNDE